MKTGMKIVILDGFTENPGDLSWDGLRACGDLTVYDRTPADLTAQRMQGAEAVFTNKTIISAEIMEKCPALKFIGVLATGVNIVDIKAASDRGIVVSNVPAYGTASVAQFTMALLLELCHHVGAHSQAVKNGEWGSCPDFCFWKYPLTELAGKTMGIIGFGNVGRTVARMALAFGMKVLAYSHHEIPGELLTDGIRSVDLEELYRQADVISLHCPLSEKNTGMINKQSIARMKDGVFLINTARGPLINEADLKEALESGKVGGAAVDVISREPAAADNPLLKAPNMIITPHIAWAPREARQRLMDITVENMKAYLDGRPLHGLNM